MSMNSGLVRNKHGALERDGKIIILTCDTGDDSPVIADERLDVDLNRLVSNEMARQETLRIPGQQDYQDLSEYPTSRGEAEQILQTRRRALEPHVLPGESLEDALRRIQQKQAQAISAQRESNAKTPTPTPEPPKTTPTPSEATPPAHT